jgi:hypothetical protein
VDFTIRSGVLMLGVHLGVDQFLRMDRSLFFQEVKMVDAISFMVQDLVVVLPLAMVLVG